LLGQQQLQAGQQQLQQQQIQEGQLNLADKQAMNNAMHAWDGRSMDDLPGLIKDQGGSAQAVLGMKKQLLDSQIATSKLDTEKLANASTRNDLLLGSLKSATDNPDTES